MRHGGSEDSGRPGRLACLGLLCMFTVVVLEGWRLSQVYLSVADTVDVTNAPSSPLGVNELMVAVLARKRELVKVLGHINDRDGKVAFLERENQARERVLTAYSTVLKVRRDELARDTDHDTLEALIGQLKNKSSSFAHDLLLFDEKGPQEQGGKTVDAPERKKIASQAQAQVEDVVIVSRREQGEGGEGQPAAQARVGEAADEVLLDAEKNEYVLSSPKDASERAIDKRLQLDLVVVIFASAAGGVFCSVVGLPVVLGYIAGGLAIGPYGLSLVAQVVQVTTVMQLGSTLLLFYIGMDFSVDATARRVVSLHMAGSSFVLAIALAAVFTLPLVQSFLGADVASKGTLDSAKDTTGALTEAVVAGLIVAMSASGSTMRHLRVTHTLDSAHGATITALYLGQDLAFFLILAFVPLARVLAGLEGGFVPSIGLFRVFTPASSQGAGHALGYLCGRLFILGLLAALFRALLPPALLLARRCNRRWGRGKEKQQDFAVIVSVSICVLLYSLSLLVTGSEVGAFIAGSLVTSSGLFALHGDGSVKVGLRPLRHLFSALSFASSGMMLQPRFLLDHAIFLVFFVLGLQIFKLALGFGLLQVAGLPRAVALRSAAGIAQVGECAFVLNSQAMSAGLLSEGTYNLLQSATALSILCSPLFQMIMGHAPGDGD